MRGGTFLFIIDFYWCLKHPIEVSQTQLAMFFFLILFSETVYAFHTLTELIFAAELQLYQSVKTAWIKKLSENKPVLSSHVIYIIYFFKCSQYGLYKGLYIYIYAYVNESIDICLMQIQALQTLFMPFYLNILSCFGR